MLGACGGASPIAGVLILLLSGAATATIALTKLNHIANEVFPRTSQLHVAKGVIQASYRGEPQTFLIIGSDRRVGSKDAYDRNNAAHSDTLLLVHLDPAAGQTSVLSVPRDLLTTITTRSGHVYYPRKINAAYTIGSLEGGSDRAAELADRNDRAPVAHQGERCHRRHLQGLHRHRRHARLRLCERRSSLLQRTERER